MRRFFGEEHMSITAMKRALEALDELSEPYDVLKAQDALRQAIKQAETQKPVVWMYQDKSTHEVRFEKHMRGFIDHGATYETPLYTTPPQRKPLTDEDVERIIKSNMSLQMNLAGIRADFEAAHGIKD
jgi:hypothetical protein